MGKIMKKPIFWKKAILSLAAVLVLSACVDPIFFMVSQEMPPRTARIPGAPTNMVIWRDHLVVASGLRIFTYQHQVWDGSLAIPSPGGRISMLAATQQFLFAIVDGTVRRWDGGSWTTVSGGGGGRVQSIFAPTTVDAAGQSTNSTILFVGVGSHVEATSVWQVTGDAPAMNLLVGSSGVLAGVAQVQPGGNFFLAMRYTGTSAHQSVIDAGHHMGNHVFRWSGTGNVERLTASDVQNGFNGIIAIGDSVVAIDRLGNLFVVPATGTSFGRRGGYAMDGFATGVLAVFQHSNDEFAPLLLAGRQGSLSHALGARAFTLGYMEIAIPGAPGFNIPGAPPAGNPTSVVNPDRFPSTIGRRAVSHILQAPANVCSERRLFASTHGQGLWSYRDHFGNGAHDSHWNAEY
ncbi:MAG: hypothetical protein FWG66_11205 [Spirochaetes bacterium]|nr:hypothetical protein [Spirochaetota bacterium]